MGCKVSNFYTDGILAKMLWESKHSPLRYKRKRKGVFFWTQSSWVKQVY